MDIRLHKNATTTPARRAAIQASDKPVRELAREFGVSEDTIRRWRKRATTEDGSHTAHRLLKRHGISTMPTETKPRRPSKPFKAYDPATCMST